MELERAVAALGIPCFLCLRTTLQPTAQQTKRGILKHDIMEDP